MPLRSISCAHTYTDSCCCCCVGNAYETATVLRFISAPVFKDRMRKLSTRSFHESALVCFRPMLASVSTNLLLAIWPLDCCLPPIVLKAHRVEAKGRPTHGLFMASFLTRAARRILFSVHRYTRLMYEGERKKNCMQIICFS